MRLPFLLMAGTMALGQSPPAFEVASIKPVEGFPNARFNVSGPRVTMSGFALEGLVMDAYKVEPWQLSGGPAWRDTDPFDILAKVPGDSAPNPEQIRRMLQTLLEDRFKLKVHREMKEGPVYALVVNKKGPKLKPSISAHSSFSAGGPRRTVQLTFQKQTMEYLALQLSHSGGLGRPVLDKTGLSGVWDLTLTFAGGNPLPDSNVPDIFTAVQEQLGLKLESQKALVEKLTRLRLRPTRCIRRPLQIVDNS
jgi:uncharacterized protein (TIGR03435 family)